MSDPWQGNQPSFEDLDAATNGVISKLAAGYDPSKYQARQQASQQQPTDQQQIDTGSPALNKLLSGMSAFNSSFMQGSPAGKLAQLVPGVKNTLQQTTQASENLRQQNPGAAALGKLGGIVGSAVNPTLALGGGIAGSLASSATSMAPYATIRGLNVAQQTGSPWEGVKAGIGSEALGTAIGTGLGAAGLAFGKIAKAAHPELEQIDLASRGFSGSDIAKPNIEYARKMGLNPQGYAAEAGEPQASKILDLLKQFGGRGKAGIKKATDWVQDQYSAINQAFQASGAKLSDKIPDILNAPIVQTMKSKFNPQDVDNVINMLTNNADKYIQAGPKGWSGAVSYLNDMIEAGIRGGKGNVGIQTGEDVGENITAMLQKVSQKHGAGELLQDSASLVKAHLKELTDGVLGQAKAAGQDVPDLDLVDHLYGGYKSLQRNLARRMGKPTQSMVGGSESTAGIGTGAALAGMMGGTPAAAITKVAGMTALAPLIKRGMGVVTNEVLGRSAAAFDMLGQNIAKMGGANSLPGIAARAIGSATNVGGATIPDAASAPRPGENPQAIIASSTQSEDAAHPQVQQAAKQQTNNAWSDAIKDRLSAIYDSMIAPQYGDLMSRDDFFQAADQMTNHFDPHLTAGFVFKDKPQALAYLKSYDTALKLQGMNLNQALSSGGGGQLNPLNNPGASAIVNPIAAAITVRSEHTPESEMALENLKNIIVQHATPYGGKPDSATINQISKMIDGIAASRIPPQMKIQRLREDLQQYGIDYDQLTKYGMQDLGQPRQQTPQVPAA